MPPTKLCNPEWTQTPVSGPTPAHLLTHTHSNGTKMCGVWLCPVKTTPGHLLRRRTANSGTPSTGWGLDAQSYQYFPERIEASQASL